MCSSNLRRASHVPEPKQKRAAPQIAAGLRVNAHHTKQFARKLAVDRVRPHTHTKTTATSLAREEEEEEQEGTKKKDNHEHR